MKISSQLKQIRKDYLKIEPPPDLVEHGWLALRKEIEAHERHKFAFFPLFTRNIAFATITIILLGGGFAGLVKASQSSLPGDTLYPVKRLTENLTTAILEVVGVAKEKNDPALLEQTVKQYQEAVLQTKQEVENTGKKDEFQKKLEKQEQQFKDVSEQIPSTQDVLKEAIEASKKGRENEVKGIEHQGVPLKIEEEKEKIEAVQKEIKEIIR